MGNSIYDSATINKCFLQLKLEQCYRRLILRHIMSILICVFTIGYKGKTVQMEKASEKHRTTVAHILNDGKWDEGILEQCVKAEVIRRIYGEAERTGKPIYCIVDDTISSKTKPSSRALHPIEDAYFHQSHLKKKQDYGHQAVGVMLSCNGIVLNYAMILYDKSRSKIQIVCDIAQELPEAPVPSYFLCDCWYSCVKVMDAFLAKGFYAIGALKTNRVIFPAGIKRQISQFAPYIHKTDPNVSLVTVGKRQYYVYRYEGNLNDLESAVVLISFPRQAFGSPGALRAFLCTNTGLSTQMILSLYLKRWSIEVFFRHAKQTLALDQYQIRSSLGIRRFWVIMTTAHFLCCAGTGQLLPFQDGFALMQKRIAVERISFIYHWGVSRLPLAKVLPFVASFCAFLQFCSFIV